MTYEEYIAVRNVSRFILPKKHLLATSITFVLTLALVLPMPSAWNFKNNSYLLSAKEQAYLNEDEQAQILSSQNNLDPSKENYEDYEIPESLFASGELPDDFDAITSGDIHSLPKTAEERELYSQQRNSNISFQDVTDPKESSSIEMNASDSELDNIFVADSNEKSSNITIHSSKDAILSKDDKGVLSPSDPISHDSLEKLSQVRPSYSLSDIDILLSSSDGFDFSQGAMLSSNKDTSSITTTKDSPVDTNLEMSKEAQDSLLAKKEETSSQSQTQDVSLAKTQDKAQEITQDKTQDKAHDISQDSSLKALAQNTKEVAETSTTDKTQNIQDTPDFAQDFSLALENLQQAITNQEQVLEQAKHNKGSATIASVDNTQEASLGTSKILSGAQNKESSATDTLSSTIAPKDQSGLEANSALAKQLLGTGSATQSSEEVSSSVSNSSLGYDQTKAHEDLQKTLAALKRPQGKWYVQTVANGDTLSDIFRLLDLPYATLNRITKVAGKRDLLLSINQPIYFLIDDKNIVKEMVKPLKDGKQVRFTRMLDTDDFTVVYEDLNTHVSPQVLANIPDASEMPLATKARELRAKKEALLAQQRAEQEAKDRANNVNPKRPRLVVNEMKAGESFATAARRAGLTPTEIKDIEKITKSKINLQKLQNGDKFRVLFDGIGTNALMTAVRFDTKQGKYESFVNPEDRNFYGENEFTPTAGIFRRFPLAGEITINSKFNPHRRHPVTKKITPHNGTDFKASIGTPVYAPADGVVTYAGYQRAAGYFIIIRHENNYSTVYMHLSKTEVKSKQKVVVGQLIARTGNTGRTTGPHLHYEVRVNDRPVDPLKIKLPSSSHPNLAREQREAFMNNVKILRADLNNDKLAIDKNKSSLATTIQPNKNLSQAK